MKKFFLSLVAAIVAATATYAQSSMLATLSHEGEIRAFYGPDALKSAVMVAEDGDVITLSSGQFNATNIDKVITLRGAGMSVSTDLLNPHGATMIQGDFSINITDTQSGRIVMEGLYMKNDITYSGTIRNAQFLKCRFNSLKAISTDDTTKMTNATFIHCRIYNGFNIVANSNVYFINSLVCNPDNYYDSSSIEFNNCFIKFDAKNETERISSCTPESVHYSYYKNCIIQDVYYKPEYRKSIPSNCIAYNCVGVGGVKLFEEISTNNQTNTYVSYSVFKSYWNDNYNTYIKDTDNFELTESAAQTYLGTDGTQVGVYGGNLVYDENPVIPQITKCNVAAKSTADGKLSVDIEVKAAAY